MPAVPFCIFLSASPETGALLCLAAHTQLLRQLRQDNALEASVLKLAWAAQRDSVKACLSRPSCFPLPALREGAGDGGGRVGGGCEL